MNMDGIAEDLDFHFGRDSRSGKTAYDDRVPFTTAPSIRHGPPPPHHSYRTPYAEISRTLDRSRRHTSRFSEPVDPDTLHRPMFSTAEVQYGTGPIPPQSVAETHKPFSNAIAPTYLATTAPVIDPQMLEKIVADAVKRGVEESRKETKPSDSRRLSQQHNRDYEIFSQIPGAWPSPPTHANQVTRPRSVQRRAGTHVAWSEELGWDEQSGAKGWESSDDLHEDSWDTDETWSAKRPKSWGRVHRRTKSQIRADPVWDSSTSLEHSDSTVKPSQSRSQVQPRRTKSIQQNSDRRRSYSDHKRKSSQLFDTPQWQPQHVYHARPASVMVANAPTILSAPMPPVPADASSRKPSFNLRPVVSVAPPPKWGCASEKPRKHSSTIAFVPPAPFSTTGEGQNQTWDSSDSSSWGVTKKKTRKGGSRKNKASKKSSWAEKKPSGKADSLWGAANSKAGDWTGHQGDDGWQDGKALNEMYSAWADSGKGYSGWDIPIGAQDKQGAGDGWDTDNNGWHDKKEAAVSSWDTANKVASPRQDEGFIVERNDVNVWPGWKDSSEDSAQNNNNRWNQNNESSNNGFDANAANPWCQPNDKTDSHAAANDNIWAKLATPTVNTNADKDFTIKSKRHSTKSLSQYRRLTAPSKPSSSHRTFPPPAPSKTLRPTTPTHTTSKKSLPTVPATDKHNIPTSIASSKGIKHQVLAGPGTQYGHAVSRPEYLDRLDKPYAVFRFKYRSRSVLREMFGRDCLGKGGMKKGEVMGKEELEGLSRGELVKRMVGLQARLDEAGDGDGDGESEGTVRVARGLTEQWVKDHSK